jgi:ribosomal-protein-alanine N-acetyltransferase
MSAHLPVREARFEALSPEWLDQIMQIEQQAYTHPWSRGNFQDSMRAGYQCQMLLADDWVIGYFLAMKGVDEVHLLNLTVATQYHRQGWARIMLDALALWSRGQGAQWLWLEVRLSNQRAQHVYEQHGYRVVGRRRAYYPALDGREDAVVMSLKL